MSTIDGDGLELDGTQPAGAQEPPCRIRTMRAGDVDAAVNLDAKQTGSRRVEYYQQKIRRCVEEPRINTSLLAEVDGNPVGFLMGHLLFGEFGIPATRAVLDTLGVHPGFRKQGVAATLVSQYRKNLSALRVEAIDTLVDWDRFDLLAFFRRFGFRPSRDIDLVWDVARFPFSGGGQPVEVRPADAVDLAQVIATDSEVLGEERSAYLTAKWQTTQARPERYRFFVADVDGDLGGYLVAELYQGEFGIAAARGVIDTIGVRERHQHKGVASAMVQHLVDWVRSHEVSQMETLCRWNDWELLPFFEYVGFRPSARMNLEWRID